MASVPVDGDISVWSVSEPVLVCIVPGCCEQELFFVANNALFLVSRDFRAIWSSFNYKKRARYGDRVDKANVCEGLKMHDEVFCLRRQRGESVELRDRRARGSLLLAARPGARGVVVRTEYITCSQ